MGGHYGFWDGTIHFVDNGDINGPESWEIEARELFSVRARITRNGSKYDVWTSFKDSRRASIRQMDIDYGDVVEIIEKIILHDRSMLVIISELGEVWKKEDIEMCFEFVDLSQRLQLAFPMTNIKFLFATGQVLLQSNVRLVT
jgi:hypothetical protein